jgi:hypothetical protein
VTQTAPESAELNPYTEQPKESPPILVRHGRYFYPPGLRLNLPFYPFHKFFQPGNPILLFQRAAS